jgi:hypothetical protein
MCWPRRARVSEPGDHADLYSPREHGFQAVIEHFNGLEQAKVWQRFHHADLAMVQSRSEQFLAAYCWRMAQRTEHIPPRRPFPTDWSLNLQGRACGQVIYLRRIDAQGMSPSWDDPFRSIPYGHIGSCAVRSTLNIIRSAVIGYAAMSPTSSRWSRRSNMSFPRSVSSSD